MTNIFRILYIILLYVNAIISWDGYYGHYHYEWDNMGRRDKTKVEKMCMELIQGITLRQRQLTNIKQEHSSRISFEIGIVIGKLREKYKRIMDLYREMIDRHRQRNLMIGPAVWDLRPFYFVLAMEQIKGLEIEIDHLVEILETLPTELVNQDKMLTVGLPDKEHRRPKGRDAHIGYPADGGQWLRVGPESVANITTEKPRKTKKNIKVNLDYKGSPVPKFKSQEELKKFLRDSYQATEGPKAKDRFLDHLYGIV